MALDKEQLRTDLEEGLKSDLKNNFTDSVKDEFISVMKDGFEEAFKDLFTQGVEDHYSGSIKTTLINRAYELAEKWADYLSDNVGEKIDTYSRDRANTLVESMAYQFSEKFDAFIKSANVVVVNSPTTVTTAVAPGIILAVDPITHIGATTSVGAGSGSTGIGAGVGTIE